MVEIYKMDFVVYTALFDFLSLKCNLGTSRGGLKVEKRYALPWKTFWVLFWRFLTYQYDKSYLCKSNIGYIGFYMYLLISFSFPTIKTSFKVIKNVLQTFLRLLQTKVGNRKSVGQDIFHWRNINEDGALGDIVLFPCSTSKVWGTRCWKLDLVTIIKETSASEIQLQ